MPTPLLTTQPKLSRYFNWAEVTRSDIAERKGILNSLPLALVPSAQYTAYKMDEVRMMLNRPVLISSWYRSLELNRMLGSKDTSAHVQGLGVDWICPEFGLPFEVAKHLASRKSSLDFDQLILEHTWIHISFARFSEPKRQVLSLLQNGGYAIGLTDKFGTPYK